MLVAGHWPFFPAAARKRPGAWHLQSPAAPAHLICPTREHPRTICSVDGDTMAGPSVLEYARYHRLSAPHTALDLSKYLNAVSRVHIDEDTLAEPEFSPQYDVLAESKLQLGSNTAKWLAKLTNPPKVVKWEHVLNDPFRLQKLKMEQAMLTSDHEKDLRWFKRPMDLSNIIKELRRGCAERHSNEDDTTTFLDRCEIAAATIRPAVEYPRLQSTQDALAILSRSTQDQWTNEDLCKVYDGALAGAKVYHALLEVLRH